MPVTLAGPPTGHCWTAVKHTGNPEGRIEPLGGLNTYISEPPPNAAFRAHKKVLLFLADAYGPLFINNKLLQDYFASQGFVVLGPDYFFGVPVQNLPPDRGKVAWSLEARAAAIEVFPRWFERVKATYEKALPTSYPSDTQLSCFCSLGTEMTKYVAVGYCFGALFVLDLAAEGSVVAGAIAHPGFLEDSHFQKLNKPLLLSCAEDDFTFPLEARRRAEDILVSNKSTYFIQVFSGVSHGFAVRGDPNVPHARWAKEESARGIAEWFFRFAA